MLTYALLYPRVAEKSTHISKNNFHRILNRSPCKPLHKILVLSPRPSNPVTPSCRTTSLAASATVYQYSAREAIGKNQSRLTVRNLCIINLSICLDNSQRIRHRIRHNRSHEADESETQKPDDDGVLWWCWDSLGEEVVSSKPGIMTNESCGGSGECTPP